MPVYTLRSLHKIACEQAEQLRRKIKERDLRSLNLAADNGKVEDVFGIVGMVLDNADDDDVIWTHLSEFVAENPETLNPGKYYLHIYPTGVPADPTIGDAGDLTFCTQWQGRFLEINRDRSDRDKITGGPQESIKAAQQANHMLQSTLATMSRQLESVQAALAKEQSARLELETEIHARNIQILDLEHALEMAQEEQDLPPHVWEALKNLGKAFGINIEDDGAPTEEMEIAIEVCDAATRAARSDSAYRNVLVEHGAGNALRRLGIGSAPDDQTPTE